VIAELTPGYDGSRQVLKDIVPLETPFTLFISPSQLCNFKCHFCSHSLPIAKKTEAGLRLVNQDFEVLRTIAGQSQEFPDKYKRILLTGLGEPLLNPRIVDMVRLLNEYDIAERLEIFTNGSLLDKTMADGLIEAGLARLRISVQGTDAAAYKEHCRVKLDFEDFVDNIRYFYEASRGRCSIYIKIIDEELRGQEDRRLFFDIFSGICDEIFVENLVRAQPMMGDYDGKVASKRTFYGEPAAKREVCPYIFYTLQTDAEGNCFPCPPLSLPLSFSIGNIHQQTLREIWNGKRMRALRISHLRKNGTKCKLCRECTCYLAFTPAEDNLDEDASKIMERIEKARQCQR
jgi:MoaA/NifB/PqqE/SkfB family radical SAM enzyme